MDYRSCNYVNLYFVGKIGVKRYYLRFVYFAVENRWQSRGCEFLGLYFETILCGETYDNHWT